MKYNSSVRQKSSAPAIAIFCRELKENGDPFSNDYYWQAYQDLLLALKARGVEAYLATDNNTYRGYGEFDVAYVLNKKTTVDNLERVENVHVDLVFDRGRFIGRDVLIINPPILTKIAMSKIEMYEYFTDLQPYSIVGKTKKQAIKAADKIPGKKIVVKEPEGSGGNEVYIGEKEEVLAELPNHYPVLVQEFLDTSAGVPDQVEGVHDVRLALCGGEIISYYVRSARDGELHANVAQGGRIVYFDVSEAPAELIEAVRLIDGLFADLPRYYSLDFMNTSKGWKLVELNSYLGLMPADDSPQARQTLDKLADYLVTECRNQAERDVA
jgi:glutathione synthase/RimK-type ligase-like ATP-grasp enzyme